MHTPDRWVLLRIVKDADVQFKVLGSWSGSYLYGGSWRLNSGIVKVEDDGDYILFHGASGSTYKCHKESYGLTSITGPVFEEFKDACGDAVEVVEDYTSWIHLV